MVFVGILILSFSLVLARVTLAWFWNGKSTQVEPFDADVLDVYHIMVRTDESDWAYDVELRTEKELSPITGDGVSFFTPRFTLERVPESNGVVSYMKKVEAYDPLPEADLPENAYVLDFQIQTQHTTPLYLSKATEVRPENSSAVASDGALKDMGAGALRMALLQKTAEGEYALCYYYVPNPEYELQSVPGGGYAATSSGTPEKTYEIRTAADASFTVVPADYPQGYVTSAGTVYVFRMPEDGTLPSTVTVSEGEDNYFRLVVWLEGTDRECKDAVAGGRIYLRLQLTTNESGSAE